MNKLKELASRPATIVFSSRVDARYLATTLLYWQERGEHPRSISELVRLNEEIFAEFLVLSKKVEFVQTQAAAREIILKAGLNTKGMDTKNKRNLVNALKAEEGFDIDSIATGRAIDGGHKEVLKDRPIAPDGPEMLQAQKLLRENLDKGVEDQVEDAHKRTQDFKKGLGINPEGGEGE